MTVIPQSQGEQGKMSQATRGSPCWFFQWFDEGRYCVVFRCPNGHEGTLGVEHHAIGHDGKVAPSVVCPRDGCGFHDYVTLKDWEAPKDARRAH